MQTRVIGTQSTDWHTNTYTHKHIRLTALCPGLPGWAGSRNVKSIWILLEQETVSDSGIRWAICKSAPHSRQTTTPAPHLSVFYRPDALPAAQPTVSKNWRQEDSRLKTDIAVDKLHWWPAILPSSTLLHQFHSVQLTYFPRTHLVYSYIYIHIYIWVGAQSSSQKPQTTDRSLCWTHNSQHSIWPRSNIHTVEVICYYHYWDSYLCHPLTLLLAWLSCCLHLQLAALQTSLPVPLMQRQVLATSPPTQKVWSSWKGSSSLRLSWKKAFRVKNNQPSKWLLTALKCSDKIHTTQTIDNHSSVCYILQPLKW